MPRIDESFNQNGDRITRRWPEDAEGNIDPDGLIVDWDGSTRPLTVDERTAVEAEQEQADRDADAAALRDDLQVMKDARDEAATSRTEMDAPDGEGSLSRWNPVKENAVEAFPDPTVDEAAWRAEVEARIEDQAKLLNLTVKEVRRVYGDVRSMAAALVRKFRKDRDDQ